MSFQITIDNVNIDVIKFGMPIKIIEEFCFGNCEIFAYILQKKIGGVIYQINNDHFVLLYKDMFIDVYGIHTEKALRNRTLPIVHKNDLRYWKSYGDEFNLIEILIDESILNNYKSGWNPYTICCKEYTEFIIDLILNGNIFKTFDKISYYKIKRPSQPLFENDVDNYELQNLPPDSH